MMISLEYHLCKMYEDKLIKYTPTYASDPYVDLESVLKWLKRVMFGRLNVSSRHVVLVK